MYIVPSYVLKESICGVAVLQMKSGLSHSNKAVSLHCYISISWSLKLKISEYIKGQLLKLILLETLDFLLWLESLICKPQSTQGTRQWTQRSSGPRSWQWFSEVQRMVLHCSQPHRILVLRIKTKMGLWTFIQEAFDTEGTLKAVHLWENSHTWEPKLHF